MARIELKLAKEEMIKKLKSEVTHVTILNGFNLGDELSGDDLGKNTPDRRGTVKKLEVSSINTEMRVTNSVAEGNWLVFGAIGGIPYDNISLLKLKGSNYQIMAQEKIGSTSRQDDHPILIPGFTIRIY